ncbi:MAG TPA: type II toxin-antitoxin system VapC family toxin [Geminicoccaceae bacterium]|nr:type II toxin-antitoxin system VapC family toxin [Geminicoccaceae bacterium]
MVKALFDNNILIDFLNAAPEARDELARHPEKAISVITWMEVMVGAPPAADTATRDFLHEFHLIELDDKIAERAVSLRRAQRLELPDAIVWASAQIHGMLLVTRNSKDFPQDDPGVRMPYRLPLPSGLPAG